MFGKPKAEVPHKKIERVGRLSEKEFIARAVFASLISLGIAEFGHVGARPITVEQWYEESVAQAKHDYQAFKKDPHEGRQGYVYGGNADMSFEQYLEMRHIPSAAFVAALEQQLESYDDPVQIFEGTTLLRMLVHVIPGLATDASYGFGLRGNAIYLTNNEGFQQNLFTTEDLWLIITEVAHVQQFEEQGRARSVWRHITDFLSLPFIEGGLHEGRGVLYSSRERLEGYAHGVLEPRLTVEVIARMLNEQYQNEKHLFAELLARSGFIATDEEFTYEVYTRMMDRLSIHRGQRSVPYIDGNFLFIVEHTPGYEAHSYYNVFVVTPTQEHYGNLLRLLQDAEHRGGAMLEKQK